MNTERIQAAQEMAVRFHECQVDKAGRPYFLHVLRVSAAGMTEDEQILGAIHDLFEDTHCSPSLIKMMFGYEVLQALIAISREPGETYRAYIGRVNRNNLARSVKINDLHDNLSRLGMLADQKEAGRLATRYRSALTQLGSL